MQPSQSQSTRPQSSYKSQKLSGQKRVSLKFVQEDDEVRCENAQILMGEIQGRQARAQT